MQQYLLTTGDFLSVTLGNPDGLSPMQWQLQNGTKVQIWDTGIICFEPEQAGNNDIVLSCGMHGNETAPIEICAGIVTDILLGRIQLAHRVQVLFGNPHAINCNQREVVENINTLFSGQHSKKEGVANTERKRARLLEEYLGRFYVDPNKKRFMYDLHTAIRGSVYEKFAVYPFLHGKPWSKTQFEFLLACDINTILLMKAPATSFSYYASHQYAAEAFTIELGQVRPFGQNDMNRFQGIITTLRAFMTGEPVLKRHFAESDFNIYKISRAINKQTTAFKLHFSQNIENFTSFPVGTLLATDGATEYRIEQEGEAIIFPNANVAAGQRAMLLVVPYSVAGQLI